MSAVISKPKTQRRGVETKRQLVEPTKRLLAKYNYQTITLDQIAAEVGVAKSSILWHFGSKDNLLTDAVFDLFEEVDQKITLARSDLNTLEERIEYLLKSVAEYYAANPEAKGISITLIFNSQVPAAIHDRIREQWEQHAREIQDFLSTDDLQISAETAGAILALMQGSYMHWYVRGRNDDLGETLLEAFRALRHETGRLVAGE